jgi:hypothetical protein
MTKDQLSERIYILCAAQAIQIHGTATEERWLEERARMAIIAAEVFIEVYNRGPASPPAI